MSEVEVIACPVNLPPRETECTDWYHYQDYGGEIIDTLYGHVFGNIHCNCGPTVECANCGNANVEVSDGEECDTGRRCDDFAEVSP